MTYMTNVKEWVESMDPVIADVAFKKLQFWDPAVEMETSFTTKALHQFEKDAIEEIYEGENLSRDMERTHSFLY